jgi:hypothetical protein
MSEDITAAQFRTKSEELKKARIAAEGRLEAVRSRLSRLEEMERSKDAIMAHYASLVPQGLAELSSEERNQVYKTMNLQVHASRDDMLIADWGCNDAPLPRWSSISTTLAFRFRSVLGDEGSEEVELVEAQRQEPKRS